MSESSKRHSKFLSLSFILKCRIFQIKPEFIKSGVLDLFYIVFGILNERKHKQFEKAK